jgi:hypothetical protein
MNHSAIQKISLEDYLQKDSSLPTAYLRAVGSIAAADGKVSLSEYAALKNITNLTGKSALAGTVLHHALENPLSTEDAFKQLGQAAKDAELATRKACFEAAKPLLSLQGSDTKKLAQKLSDCLRCEILEDELKELCISPNTSLFNMIAKKTMKKFRGEGLVDFAEECYRVTGERDVLNKIHAFRNSTIDENDLRNRIREACTETQHQLSKYEDELRQAEQIENVAGQFVDTVKELDNHLSQRLEVFKARATFERTMFEEDIKDSVHDAGNAIELEIADRLKTDKWELEQVWDSIAQGSFGKELERRVGRMVSRREDSLRMFMEDLRLFQNELRINRANILERKHHAEYAKLMPSLRLKTRIPNAVDDAANVTLWSGALSLAGTGGATYLLGISVVFPVIAPLAPIVGGAIAVAGVWKWLSNPNHRKDKEIRHKRDEFEKIFYEQLKLAQENFNKNLDSITHQFEESRERIVDPLMLEALAAEQLEGMQSKVAFQLIRNSRSATTRLINKLSALPA